MDIAFTAEERAFREEVRQLLRDNMPPELRRKLAEGRKLSKHEKAARVRILHGKASPPGQKNTEERVGLPCNITFLQRKCERFTGDAIFGAVMTLGSGGVLVESTPHSVPSSLLIA